MRKYLYFIIATLFLASAAFAAESQIWGDGRVLNIFGYGQVESLKLGPLFTMLQKEYFEVIFFGILVGVPSAFFLHYLIIGPKVFPHGGKKIYVFNLFHRFIHQIAALSFIVIVPTGFIIIFGAQLGGGSLVRLAKDMHGLATIPFAIVVIPMFLMWLKDAFFNFDDVKWIMIVGGYLSKEKKPIPAGKFNAGQKMWYWIATLGGMIMIITGATMYFMDFDIELLRQISGLTQIDLLRFAAIVHNVMGFGVVVFFIVHLYMAMFAIKGAVHAIIDGHMEDEEVKILHGSYYKKLKEEGKI
ncbi:MAG: formate dehydrogenase subunit gamma [Sulfurospirillum sp.]|nr:formate dehydrogenase subunit gamma [Sulfurospirillum sp.]